MATPKVVAVTLDGVIHPITAEIVGHVIDQAETQGAAAVLIRLNTPGGLLDATRHINERINAARLPVITYVTPSGGRAASAGFIILEAGDVAAMGPGTHTGRRLTGADERRDGSDDAFQSGEGSGGIGASAGGKRGRTAVAEAEAAIMHANSYTDGEALGNHLADLVAANEAELLRTLDGREIKTVQRGDAEARFEGRGHRRIQALITGARGDADQ